MAVTHQEAVFWAALGWRRAYAACEQDDSQDKATELRRAELELLRQLDSWDTACRARGLVR